MSTKNLIILQLVFFDIIESHLPTALFFLPAAEIQGIFGKLSPGIGPGAAVVVVVAKVEVVACVVVVVLGVVVWGLMDGSVMQKT